jgi:hypothetical protein
MNLFVGKKIQIKTKEELLKTPLVYIDKEDINFRVSHKDRIHHYSFIREMLPYSRKIAKIVEIINEDIDIKYRIPYFKLKDTPFVWESWMVKDILEVMLKELT